MRPALRISLGASLLPLVLGMTQSASQLPFGSGERLVYNAHAGPGLNARAEMWIEGPTELRGTQVLVLNSEIKGGFGPLKVSDRATSWLDTGRMAILRYVKEEKTPLGKHFEDVEVEINGRGWRDADGRTGESPTDQPLDELSFIYVMRTMRLPDDSAVVLNRHFDPERDPTIVRSLGPGSVTIEGRAYQTREIEMRVRDARRYRGEGVIRISISDDACRRPVRIESKIPKAGKVVMELREAEPEVPGC